MGTSGRDWRKQLDSFSPGMKGFVFVSHDVVVKESQKKDKQTEQGTAAVPCKHWLQMEFL
jgi:hypothetical protein